MGQIIDPMAAFQGYQTNNQMNALRAQQMEMQRMQESRASALQPLQMEAQNLNILAKRMAMDEDRQRRNALQQFGATGNMNALAQADPATFAKMRMKQMELEQARNAPPKPIWDSTRGVFIQPPGPQGAPQVIRPQGMPQMAPPVTKGQEAVDREFAKEYVAFTAAGGYADVDKQLDQLREVKTALKSGANLTGPIIGATNTPLLNIVNPKAIAARDAVEEVVQRNLRLILGAQFTEEEGKRLIARAYNPSLPEAENEKRLDRLITQIEAAAKAKASAAKYYEKNGSLVGWKGEMPSWGSFNPDGKKGGASGGWSVEEVK
jgi:hypothetical protein